MFLLDALCCGYLMLDRLFCADSVFEPDRIARNRGLRVGIDAAIIPEQISTVVLDEEDAVV